MGSGDGRHQPLRFREESSELLRAVRSREEFGRQDRADADLKTKKQAFANYVDRSSETGAALERGTGAGLRVRETERKSQPGHTGRSPQTRGLPDGRRPRRTAVRHTPQSGRQRRLRARNRNSNRDAEQRDLPGLAVWGLGKRRQTSRGLRVWFSTLAGKSKLNLR